MELAIVIGIIALGVFLVIVEIFFIPGITVFGIAGAIVIVGGVFYSFIALGTEGGFITLGVTSVISMILFYLSYKMIQSRRFAMDAVIDSQVNVLDREELGVNVGDKGMAFTDLRPNGRAKINDKKIEVYSLGEFVEKDTTLEVVKITSDKVFIKPLNS